LNPTNTKKNHLRNINLELEISGLERSKKAIKLKLSKIDENERKALKRVKPYTVRYDQVITAKDLMTHSSYKKTSEFKSNLSDIMNHYIKS